ncbi:Zinc finger CCCH domain-containing protein [Yarrowia sp. C11]|nr:Zinc finger CCCH domain-containing protein [Yarrowia sp. C11]KAG5364478.1 Zinc finger CCCH domain-containing protein [Yarrowia sp. E02]
MQILYEDRYLHKTQVQATAYTRSSGCNCRYSHVKHNDDAPYCFAFNDSGWCDRGKDCPDRHDVKPEGAVYGVVNNPALTTVSNQLDDTQDVDLDRLALMLDDEDKSGERHVSDSDDSVEELLQLGEDQDDGAFVAGDDFVKF